MHRFTRPFRTEKRLKRTNGLNKRGKHYKKWISVILVITLVMMISGIVTAVEAGEDAAPVMFTSSSEEKVYCNATLEHDFAENRVMVVLSNEASLAFNTYETADFGEIGCAGVKNLSQASGRKIQAKAETLKAAVMTRSVDLNTLDTSGINTYNQVLCLELEDGGKENVLAAIDELMKRDNVDDCGSAFDDMCVSGGRLNAYKALTNVKRHSLNYTDSEIDSKHIIICASCGCEGMRPHDYDNISFLNILKHKISCDCGAYVLESHTWNVTKTRCLSCDYSLEGPVEYQVYFKKTGLTV